MHFFINSNLQDANRSFRTLPASVCFKQEHGDTAAQARFAASGSVTDTLRFLAVPARERHFCKSALAAEMSQCSSLPETLFPLD